MHNYHQLSLFPGESILGAQWNLKVQSLGNSLSERGAGSNRDSFLATNLDMCLYHKCPDTCQIHLIHRGEPYYIILVNLMGGCATL